MDVFATWFEPDNLQIVGQVVLVIVFFAGLGRLIGHFLGTTVHRLTKSTNTHLDDVILQAIRSPVQWLVTLVGAIIAFNLAANSLPDDWRTLVDGVLFVLFASTVAILIYRLIRDLMDWYVREMAMETETALDDLLVPFFRRALLLIIVSITSVLLLQHFKVEVTGFLATLGVGSLAVALAAQAALSDVISGFLILIDRRYRVGDRIELLEEGILGDVIEIGLRTTRIQTPDNRVIIIPNSIVANNMVINHAYPDATLRVDLPIGVAYGVEVRQVKALLLSAIRQVEGVQRDRRPDIVLVGFGDNALDLEMRCWIDAYADKPRMIDRINEAAYLVLEENGIEIPFPQRTLWHRVERQALPYLRAVVDGSEPPPEPVGPPDEEEVGRDGHPHPAGDEA